MLATHCSIWSATLFCCSVVLTSEATVCPPKWPWSSNLTSDLKSVAKRTNVTKVFQGMVDSQFRNLLRKSASSRAALRFALQLKRRETFSCGQIYYCLAFWMKRKCCSNKNPYLARRWLKAKETLQMCLRRKKWLTGWQKPTENCQNESCFGDIF